MTPNSSSYPCWDLRAAADGACKELCTFLTFQMWMPSTPERESGRLGWRQALKSNPSPLPVPRKAPWRPPSRRREQRQTATHSPFPSLQQEKSNDIAKEHQTLKLRKDGEVPGIRYPMPAFFSSGSEFMPSVRRKRLGLKLKARGRSGGCHQIYLMAWMEK